MKTDRSLSKTKFVAGWQCLKRLYLQVYHRELAAKIDDATQAILTQGQKVGELARKVFPGGVLINASHLEVKKALEDTRRFIADSSVPAIFEAAFLYDNVLVRVDILARGPSNLWRLIEVKSSTGVKENYHYDLAIQKHVLTGSDLELQSCSLMYLNRDYVYDGIEYRLDDLFIIEELDTEIDRTLLEIPQLLAEMKGALREKTAPDIKPGPQCSNPVICEFFDHCNLPLPLEHVANLPGLKGAKLARLLDSGITVISELPSDFPLSEKQQRAYKSVIEGKPRFENGIQEAFKEFNYPLYFMDFETLYPALPRFAEMRPYDHIPFQWSVHIQDHPYGELRHHEFLAENESDPRLEFLLSLLEVLKTEGDIVVYNKGFESSRLNDLANWFPAYKSQIESIQKRLWDLLPVVRNNVYHPEFQGSFSIKTVLPALIPDMKYEGMPISNGEQAGAAWEKMVSGNLTKSEKELLRQGLLAYCRQDTIAMVRLLESLGKASL
ncbi:MAG: DUF2779 domain-containing protein [Terriglobia bacterium]